MFPNWRKLPLVYIRAMNMDANPLQNFIDGDDVEIIVGLIAIGSPEEPLVVASVIVDYKAIKDHKLRDSYTKTIDAMWEEDALKRGLDLIYKDKSTLRIESKRRAMAMSISAEVQQVVAPFYHVEIECGEDSIREFDKRKSETGVWILHLRTDKHSYFMCVDNNNGDIISKTKRDPFEIKE